MKPFITGGSGFCGRNLIRYLVENKLVDTTSPKPVIKALSRSSEADALIRGSTDKPHLIEIVRGDLHDMKNLVSSLEGCTVVFHLAAKAAIWGPWEEFEAANVHGTAIALEATQRAKVPRFVHVSTEATLLTGRNNGCLDHVDETAPLALNPPFYAPYTKSKAMAEKLVLEANSASTATVAVRPRMVWGKGDTTLLPEFAAVIRSGQLKWFTPLTKCSTCHVDNLSEGSVLAAEKGKPGEVYFLTDGEPPLFKDFITRYLNAAGVKTDAIGTLPAWVAWLFAIIVENIPFAGFGTTRKPPINRQALGLFAQTVVVLDTKARRDLGYKSHMTMEEGLRRMSP